MTKPFSDPQQGPLLIRDHPPPEETRVLIFVLGKWRTAELCWESPSWEESWPAFTYWADEDNEGLDWADEEILWWMPMPPDPPEVPVLFGPPRHISDFPSIFSTLYKGLTT